MTKDQIIPQSRRHYNVKDLTGKVYGKLLVKAYAGSSGNGSGAVWECQCECGKTFFAEAAGLSGGGNISCGCAKWVGITTHGKSKTPEFHAWSDAKSRCYNIGRSGYHNYGARGITMCPEWVGSFETFLRDVGPRPAKGYTLERLDNNSGYEPGNCVWATRAQQSRNTRHNKLVTISGRTQCLADWLRGIGIHYKSMQGRMQHGMSLEEALTTPKKICRREG